MTVVNNIALREYHQREQGVLDVLIFVVGSSNQSSVDFTLIAVEDGSLNGMAYLSGDNVIAAVDLSAVNNEEMEIYAPDASQFEVDQETGDLMYNF